MPKDTTALHTTQSRDNSIGGSPSHKFIIGGGAGGAGKGSGNEQTHGARGKKQVLAIGAGIGALGRLVEGATTHGHRHTLHSGESKKDAELRRASGGAKGKGKATKFKGSILGGKAERVTSMYMIDASGKKVSGDLMYGGKYKSKDILETTTHGHINKKGDLIKADGTIILTAKQVAQERQKIDQLIVGKKGDDKQTILIQRQVKAQMNADAEARIQKGKDKAVDKVAKPKQVDLTAHTYPTIDYTKKPEEVVKDIKAQLAYAKNPLHAVQRENKFHQDRLQYELTLAENIVKFNKLNGDLSGLQHYFQSWKEHKAKTGFVAGGGKTYGLKEYKAEWDTYKKQIAQLEATQDKLIQEWTKRDRRFNAKGNIQVQGYSGKKYGVSKNAVGVSTLWGRVQHSRIDTIKKANEIEDHIIRMEEVNLGLDHQKDTTLLNLEKQLDALSKDDNNYKSAMGKDASMISIETYNNPKAVAGKWKGLTDAQKIATYNHWVKTGDSDVWAYSYKNRKAIADYIIKAHKKAKAVAGKGHTIDATLIHLVSDTNTKYFKYDESFIEKWGFTKSDKLVRGTAYSANSWEDAYNIRNQINELYKKDFPNTPILHNGKSTQILIEEEGVEDDLQKNKDYDIVNGGIHLGASLLARGAGAYLGYNNIISPAVLETYRQRHFVRVNNDINGLQNDIAELQARRETAQEQLTQIRSGENRDTIQRINSGGTAGSNPISQPDEPSMATAPANRQRGFRYDGSQFNPPPQSRVRRDIAIQRAEAQRVIAEERIQREGLQNTINDINDAERDRNMRLNELNTGIATADKFIEYTDQALKIGAGYKGYGLGGDLYETYAKPLVQSYIDIHRQPAIDMSQLPIVEEYRPDKFKRPVKSQLKTPQLPIEDTFKRPVKPIFKSPELPRENTFKRPIQPYIVQPKLDTTKFDINDTQPKPTIRENPYERFNNQPPPPSRKFKDDKIKYTMEQLTYIQGGKGALDKCRSRGYKISPDFRPWSNKATIEEYCQDTDNFNKEVKKFNSGLIKKNISNNNLYNKRKILK